jgi:origin recognition complex subunit 2
LTEFRDHKLLKSKRGADGAEYLNIPIDKAALSAFLDTLEEK